MLDLADAESVKRWISIAPERHIAMLRGLYRLPLMAEFRATIEIAVKQHKGAHVAPAPKVMQIAHKPM